MKHTPGPWDVSENGYIKKPNSDNYIPFKTPWDNGLIAEAVPEDVLLANARLIAAAPLLLDILKRLHTQTRRMNDRQHAGITITPEEWSTLYILQGEALEAIAKAEGGTS